MGLGMIADTWKSQHPGLQAGESGGQSEPQLTENSKLKVCGWGRVKVHLFRSPTQKSTSVEWLSGAGSEVAQFAFSVLLVPVLLSQIPSVHSLRSFQNLFDDSSCLPTPSLLFSFCCGLGPFQVFIIRGALGGSSLGCVHSVGPITAHALIPC